MEPPPLGDFGVIITFCQSHWLEEFSRGFFSLAEQHAVELVGGDTTRGPLNLSITIMGEVPEGKALRRDGACVDDDIWVSGALGKAALALAHRQGRIVLPRDELSDCERTCINPSESRIGAGAAQRCQ